MGGQRSYADFYRAALERQTGRSVELTNLGRPGWTSGHLLAAIRDDQRFRQAIARADVITWDIGGNDIIGAVLRSATRTCGGGDGLACIRDTTTGFATRWDAIVNELATLPLRHDVALRTFDLYTPFVPAAARTEHVLDQLEAMNATIRASDGRGGVEVAPVAAAFARPSDVALISDDGLHPSPAGHRLIARLLLRLGVPNQE